MTTRFRWTYNESRVYDILRARADENLIAHITMDDIASATGVVKSSVNTALVSLRRAGIVQNLDRGAGRRGCTYRILVDA